MTSPGQIPCFAPLRGICLPPRPEGRGGGPIKAVWVCLLGGLLLPVVDAAPIPGQGTWQTTLQSRDLDGNPGDGPEAFYDTDLNITWLRETSVDYGNSLGNPLGGTSFSEGQDWVSSLNVGGVSGWRLPATLPVDGASFSYTFSYDGTTDFGYWSTASEMAHLFYVTLGNTGYCPHSDVSICAGSLPVLNPIIGMTNSGQFANLIGGVYISGTPFAPNPGYDTWVFSMWYGDQDYCFACGPLGEDGDVAVTYALAVHDGDVGVPIPAVAELPTVAFMLAGIGLVAAAASQTSGLGRRRAQA